MKSATLIWDADGTSGAPTGGTGIWNTDPTPTLWDNGGVMQAWDNGGNHTAVFGGTAGTVTLGTSITAGGLIFNSTGYTLAPAGAETLTLGGPISVTASGHTATISAALAGTLTKTGAGTLELTADSTATFTGVTTIDGGTLRLSGSGSLAGASGLTLSNRGVLTLDNGSSNNGDRIAGAVASSGGTINFLGNAASTTETLGAVTLNPGALTINTTPGAGGSVLTIPSITRNNGGTLYVNGPGLGTASNQVILTTAPALTNTILKYAAVNDGTVARFATHGGDGTSLAPQLAGYTASEASWTAAGVNALPTADQTVAGARTLYSLTLDNGIDLLTPAADRTLTIGGAVLQSGGSSVIGATSGSNEHVLAFGTNEALFITLGDLDIQRGNTANVTTATGSPGITKSGPGMLTVRSMTLATGGILRLNEGTFRAVGTNGTTAGTSDTTLGGTSAAVHLNGGTLSLASGSSTTYSASSGTIVVNADSTIVVDRTAAGGAVTHGLGILSIGGRTLSVNSGSLINADSAYGLNFANTTLTAPTTFSIVNNGTGTGTLSLSTVTNSGGHGITKIGNGDLVTSSSSAGFNSPIEVQAGRVGWSASAGSFSDSSLISGAGGLIKANSGTVTVTGANTFTGGMTVSGGMLAFSTVSNNGGPASNLGRGTDGITIGAATLNFVGGASQTTDRAITVSGAATFLANGTSGASIAYTGAVAAGANAVTLDGPGNGSIGSITQSGTTVDLIKNGTGTWTMLGSNAIADDFIVNAGKVILAGANAHQGDDFFVRTGALVELAINDALLSSGVDALVVGDTVGANDATLDLKGFNASVNAVTVGLSSVTGKIVDTVGTGVLTTGSLDLRSGEISADLALTGASTITKNTNGTMRLSGTVTHGTGGTTLNLGNLILDHTSENTAKINAAAALTGAGGTMTIEGSATAPTTVSVSGFTLNAGLSRLVVNSGAGQSATLNLGAITRATAGVVDFTLPTAGAINSTGTAGFVGGWATVGQARFASRDGSGNLSALTSTVRDDITTWVNGENVIDSAGYSGSITTRNLNSLIFSAAAPSTVTAEMLGVASGGILVAPSVGAGPASIAGGMLASGAADLIISQHNTGSTFTLGSWLGGTTVLTKVGLGTLRLTGANSSTGTVQLQGGTIEVTGNSIGDTTAVTLDDGNSATLTLLANETIGVVSGGGVNGGNLNIGSQTLTINQASAGTYSGTITSGASGVLVKNGAGNLVFGNSNNTATFLGSVVINQGLLHLDSATTSIGGVTAFTLNSGELLSDQDQGASVDRIGNSASITLNNTGAGRGLWLRVENQDSTRTETVGAVNLGFGHNVIASDTNGGVSTSRIIQLTMSGGLARGSNHATVLMRGQLLGATSNNRGQILMTGNLGGAIGGGTAAASATISIYPWIVGESTLGDDGTLADNYGNSFVYDADTGANTNFRPLNFTNEYTFNEAGFNGLTGATSNNVRIATNPALPLTGTASQINSLVLDSTSGALTVTGPANSLNIRSGGLLAAGANTIGLGGFTSLTVDAGSDYLLYVTNPAGRLTLSSQLTSVAPLVKSGAGTLALTAVSNSYTDTYFNQGAIEAQNLDQLGSGVLNFHGGILRWATGATFDPTTKTIVFGTGGGTFDVAETIALANGFGSGGSGSLTKIGAGTLTLNAAAGYTGSTIVSAGTLALGADQAISSGDLSVSAGATLNLGAQNANVANLTLPNSSTVSLTGTGTLTVSGTTIVNRAAITPAFAGTMNLIKQTASQTVTLSNTASSFTGYTHVQDGTLSVPVLANAGVNSPLGAPTGNNAAIRLGNGTTTGVLLVNGAGSSTDRPIWLTGTTGGGTIDNDGSGALVLDSGIVAADYGAKTLTLQGNTTGFNNALNGGIDQRFGTVNLTKAEAGTWVLTGASTHTGINTITAGVLQVNTATGGLGDSTAAGAITLNGGTLRMLHDGAGNDGVVIYGSASNPAGYNVSLAATSTINVNNLTANTGNIIALGALTQPSAAARSLNVTGGNGYAVRLSSFGLSPGTGQTTTLNPTSASLIIAGDVSNPMSGFGAGNFDTLVLDGTATGNIIEGTISDAVGATPGGDGRTIVTKQGAGTWRLNGASTYTGGTNINGGTLIVGNDSALGTGVVNFATAATTLHNGDGNRTLANNISLNFSPITLSGNGNFSFTGNLSQTGGSRTLAVSNTGTTTFGDTAVDTITLAELDQARTLTFQVASTAEGVINATVQNGPGTGADNLSKSGLGKLTINAANTYTGTTFIDNGTLDFNADQNLTGGLTFGVADTTTTVGTLDLTDANATFAGAFLVQTNSASANTITIGPSKTLTINNNFTVGGNGTASTTVANFTGGGTLVVNNTASGSFFNIGGNDNAGNKTTADMSGLGLLSVSLNTTNGTFRVNPNNGTNVANFFSTLILPATTTVTANALNVGDNGQYAGNPGDVNVLKLGSGVNTFNVNAVNIGTGIRDLGMIGFNGASGSVKIRDASGSGPAAFNMGTGGATTSVDLLGNQNTFDVTGHNADLLFGAVAIGTQGARNDDHANVFSFDQGTLVISSLIMSTKTAGAGFTTTSTMNLGGGMVTIGTGSGTAITLSTASTGTANATINVTGGTVSITGAVVKGAGTVSSNGVINLAGGILDFNGNTVGTGTNLITFNAQSGTLQNLGQLNGGATLVKSSPGTLVLDGTNTYTGATAVQDGALVLRGGANNRIPSAGSVVLGAGTTSGVLQLGDAAGASNQTLTALSTSGTGTAHAIVGGNAAYSTLTLNIAGTSTFSGALGGVGANQNHLDLVKAGTGEVTLSGASSYTGTTTINAGVLNIDSAGGLGATSSITVGNGSALNLRYSDPVADVVYTPTGTGNVLALQQSIDLTVIGFAIGGAYGSRINLGTNTLSHTGTITTDIYVNSTPTAPQYVLIDSAADGTFTGPGSFVLGTIFNGGNFVYSLGRDVGSANDRLLLNVSSQPAPLDAWWKGDLTGTGTGIWNASAMGGNTNWDTTETGGADGQVPPDENSVVHFSATGAANFATELGADMTVKKVIFESGSIANNVSLGGAHTLTIGSSSVSGSGGLTIAAGNGAGTIAISAPIVLGVAQSWNISDATSILALSGGLSGTGPFTINDTGAGTLIISGTSATYTGATNLVAGKLVLDGANRLPTATELTMGGATTSAILQLGNGNVSSTTLGGLASGAATGNAIVGGAATAATLTINQATNAVFNGGIGGGGTNENNIILVKAGPGTLTLNGVNSYTGATTVNNGTLQLGAAGSITQSASLTVSAVAGATANFDVNGRTVALTGGITLGGADSAATANILDTATGGSIALGGNVVYSATNNPLGSTISANLTTTAPRNITVGNSATAATDLTINGSIAGTGFTTDQRITFDGAGVVTLNGALSVAGSGSDLQMSGTGTLNINAASASPDDWLINTGTTNANVGNALNATDDIVIDGAGTQDSAVVNIGGTAGDTGVHQGDSIFIRNGGRINVLVDNGISAGTNLLLIGDTLSGSADAAGRLDLAGKNITTASGIQLGGAGGHLGNITGTGTITGNAGTFSLRGGSIEPGITFDGAAAITKVGDGTVTFAGSRAGTATGNTNIQEGQLVLNYATNNNSKIGGVLTLGASTLGLAASTGFTINGNASAPTAEAMASTTILPGDTAVVINSGAGQTASLALGAITRTALGGTVAFDLSSAGSSVTTTSPAASVLNWATVTTGGTTRFGAIGGGNIIQAAMTPQNDVTAWNPGENIINTGALTGTLANAGAVGTLTFDAAAASTVALATGASLNLSNGGILVNSSVGANASAITGGTIFSGSEAALTELIVHQNNTTGALAIGSNLVAAGLTKSGNGTLALSGTNRTGSRLTINEGTVQVSGGRAVSDNTILVMRQGATFDVGTSTEVIGNLGESTTNLTGGSIVIGAGGALTITQSASSTFTGAFTGGATANLTKTGAGTLTLSGNSSTYTGVLNVNQGQVLMNGANGRLGSTSIFLNGGELLSEQDQGASTDRVANGATITLNHTGGTNGLMIRTNQGGTRTDTIGTVALGFGHNVVTAHGNATNGNADFSGTTFSRGANHATALVRGNALGAGTGTRSTIRFSTAPLGSIGGSGNLAILPWLVGDLSQTGVGNTFVTNTGGTTGLRPLAAGDYTTDETGFNGLSGATTNNVRFATNPGGALSGTATAINSLVLDAATGLTVNGPLSSIEITSGAILAAGAGSHSLGGFSGIATSAGTDYIVYVTNSASTFTLNSPLTTSGVPLVKSGAGTLRLNTTGNAFNDLYINQGAVVVNDFDKLGSGAVNFAGGTLRLDAGFTDDLGGKTFNLLSGNNTLDTGANNLAATDWSLTGAGNLTKTGSGTLTITGGPSTTHTGLITWTQGTLQLNKAAGNDAIGSGGLSIVANNSPVILRNQANDQIHDSALISLTNSGTGGSVQWDMGGFAETIGGLTMTVVSNTNTLIRTGATGVLTVNGDITLNHNRNSSGNTPSMLEISGTGSPNTGTLDLGGAVRTITVESIITGPNLPGSDANIETVIRNGGIIKEGSRTLFLTGTNTYAGSTTINAGALSISASENLGDGSATNTIRLAHGATLQSTGANVDLGSNRALSLGGSSANIEVTGTNALTLPGVVSGGDGTAFNKVGTGSLLLVGENTYEGPTLVVAGTLGIGHNAALGAPGEGTTVSDGATLALNNNVNVASEPLSLTGNGLGSNGALRNLSGSNTFAGPITLAGNTTIQSDLGSLTVGSITGANHNLVVTGAGDTTISSSLSTGTGSLTKNGAGTLTLSGSNSFTGGLTLQAGRVSAGADVNLGDSAGGVTFAGASTLAASDSFAAARPFTLNATATIDVADTKTVTVSGSISGSASMIKSGNGTLVITGDNSATYSGPMTINGGTYLANNPSGSAAGDVTVNLGATFGGTGSVSGAVVINGGATISPGASIESLGVGSLSLTDGSTFTLELQTLGTLTGDHVVVASTLSLSGNITLSLMDLAPGDLFSTFGDHLTFITYAPGGFSGSGLFTVPGFGAIPDYNGEVNPTSFLFAGREVVIDYNYGPSQNEIALVVVPEPGSLASLAGAVGCLLGLQRFRRRKVQA